MRKEIKERIEMINKGEVPEGYKKTKAGIIPEDWEVFRLEEIIKKLESGISVNSEDNIATENEFGVLKTSAVSSGKFFPLENKRIIEKEVNRAKVNPERGKIIISRMNTPELVGESGYVDKDYNNLFLPDRLWQTTFNDRKYVNGKWFSSLLATEKIKFKIKNIATGTSGSMKNISKKNFLSILIGYPEKEEQQKIAQILSTWDQAIELKEKLIEEKKEQKKGLMQKLLTGEVRLAGFDGEWEEVRLGEVADLYQPQTIAQSEMELEGYPVYGANGLIGYYSKYNHETWQIMITCRGSTCGTVNKSAEKSWITGNAMVVNVDNSINVDKKFIYYLCLNQNFNSIISGSGQPQITRTPLSNFKITISDNIEEQKAIAKILTTADKEIELLTQELEQLKLQKKGLMQLLLTGIVRVKS